MSRIKIINNLPKVTAELEKSLEESLKKATYRVHRELTDILSGSRSGRVYRVPATKRFYTASAPNEAPAVRLGDLRTSYRPQVLGKGYKAEGLVGSPLDYALFLEKGTAGMEPRPHLEPAFRDSFKDWIKYFEGLIK